MTLKNSGVFYGTIASLFVLYWGGWLLFQPYLPGSDGYYFLDQTSEILRTGVLRIKNNDPTPYLVAGFIKLGIQPEFSVKLILFLAVIFWFGLGRKIETGLFFCLTPLFIFHLLQFPKLSLSILLAIQALLLVSVRNQTLFALGAGLFHPVGFCAWGLAKLRNWKAWTPWLVSAVLVIGFPLFGYFVRGQSFSMVPVGVKYLMDPHLPRIFRICMGSWIGWMILNPSSSWLMLGLLASSSVGELFGTTERWLLVLVLLSPWIVKRDKLKLILAPVSALLVGLMLQQIPKYDYKPLDDVISLSKNIDFKMLVVDQTGKFYFTAKTGKDAYFFEPENDWDKGSIWRVVKNVSPGELLPYMGKSCEPGSNTWFAVRPNMMLMREDCWDGIRAQIQKEKNEDLYDRIWDNVINPSKKRPAFLSSRNKQT